MRRFLGLIAMVAMSMVASLPAARALTLYSTGNDGTSLFTIDSTSGAGTLVGNFGYSGTYSLAFDQSNALYAFTTSSTNSTLATVDESTGAATLIGTGTGISDMMALVFAPDNTLYAASWNTNDLYTVDPGTGAVSVVGALGFSNIMDLAFSSNGTLYGLASSGSASTLYTIDTATGTGTLVTTPANSCLMGMTITPADQFLATDYCTTNSPLYQVDQSTGAVTSIGSTGINAPMGLTYQNAASSVPEPASMSLLGSGLIGIAAYRRKRA